MASVGSVTRHWITAKEGFVTTLSSTIGSGATTVPLNSTTGYTDGDQVALVVDPSNASKKQVVTGEVSGLNLINAVWTEGTNQSHTAGSAVVDYETATAWAAYAKGLKVEHNQDGTHKNSLVGMLAGSQTFTGTKTFGNNLLDATNPILRDYGGWQPLSQTVSVSSGYNKGNHEYDLTFSATMANLLSPGMWVRLVRNTAAPTQCADLEASSSQYGGKSSPTGITFTDDFTVEAWIAPESRGVQQRIIGRISGTNGWHVGITAAGVVYIEIQPGAGTSRSVTTNVMVALHKWTHVAASMDASAGTTTIYINGVSTAVISSGSASSLTQAGDLQVGAAGGTGFFDGKLSDVRLWNVVRTQTQIRDNMNQQLVGNESNLIAYYKLSGDLNDSTSNANNLTASGGAVATFADHRFSTTEYAKVRAVSTTTVTVSTGDGGVIPNMTLNTPHSSTENAPFGAPAVLVNDTTWGYVFGSGFASTTAANGQYYDIPGMTVTFTVPAGGRRYQIAGQGGGISSNTGAPPLILFSLRDGNNVVLSDTSQQVTVNTQNNLRVGGLINLPAGSNTLKLSVYVNQNPTTVSFSSWSWLLIEEA